EAQPALLVRTAAARPAGKLLRIVLELVDLDADLLLLAVAEDRELRGRTGLLRRDDHGQLGRHLDRLVVDREDHVTGLEAGFGRGTIGNDHADERAARAVEPEGIRKLRVDTLDLHADAAARHF